jgi:hypothetical protein
MARVDGTSLFTHGVAVTPNDNADLAAPCLALYIGSAGALVVTMADGTDVTFGAVTAGSLLPIRVRRVKATGTVASNIVALR